MLSADNFEEIIESKNLIKNTKNNNEKYYILKPSESKELSFFNMY